MAFVRSAWRILVAVKDGLARLFLLVFFMLLYAILSSSPNPGAVQKGALLLELNGVVSEQPAAIDPIAALMSQRAPIREFRQRDLVRALELAVSDHRINAVVLDLDRFMGGGQVSLSEIADRIDAVRRAGKPVYAFATAYSDDSYQLAAHASEIWLDPMGGVVPMGPGGSRIFYKGLIEKLGIEAHVYRVGTYKSAVEPYMRSDLSPESREAATALYDTMWGEWRADVQKARPKAQLEALLKDPAGEIEAAQGDMAKLALDSGLVDRLGDKAAFGQYLAGKVGADRDKRIGHFAATRAPALLAAHPQSNRGDAIGVITVAGEIVDGKSGPGTAAGDSVSDLIYKALEKEELKALVLRVDSPGGSVLASEKIRLALLEAKKRKLPVVVSMANLAASGGYWISTPANAIFAEPSTITGSIGIFAVLPSAQQALAKWGITSDGIRTTPLTGEPDIAGGISPEFDRVAQAAIEKGYRDFLTRVATARGKTSEQVDAIGQGRIWAGGTARQLGLVDRLGGLDDALAEAARLAKLEKDQWHPLYVDPQSDFASGLLGLLLPEPEESASIDLFGHAALRQQAAYAQIESDLRALMTARGAQARCLECGAFFNSPSQPVREPDGGLSLWLNALFSRS